MIYITQWCQGRRIIRRHLVQKRFREEGEIENEKILEMGEGFNLALLFSLALSVLSCSPHLLASCTGPAPRQILRYYQSIDLKAQIEGQGVVKGSCLELLINQ